MANAIQPDDLIARLLACYDGTVSIEAWGETSIFYNLGRTLPRGVYFATVKRKDGANDRASRLDRPGVWRFNVGAPRPLYLERFGPPPPRPSKGGVVEGAWDFHALDRITPHPVYGWMGWVAVLNPSETTLTDMREIIDGAYEKAVAAFRRKQR